ncbi:uncharacterized [Tachysurus ichikawai]
MIVASLCSGLEGKGTGGAFTRDIEKEEEVEMEEEEVTMVTTLAALTSAYSILFQESVTMCYPGFLRDRHFTQQTLAYSQVCQRRLMMTGITRREQRGL